MTHGNVCVEDNEGRNMQDACGLGLTATAQVYTALLPDFM